jgi:hypothetical protein
VSARGAGTISVGKIGELHVFVELLRRGVNPYVPLVDTEGVDAVVRRPDGSFLEIQVKAIRTPQTPRWFQVQRLQPRNNYFIVCVALATDPIETWVIPSHSFEAHSTVSQGTYDLNLDSTARGQTVPRGKLLEEYKEAWHLLVGQAVQEPLTEDEEKEA